MNGLALDVGGANLKAAYGPIGFDAAEVACVSEPFALWKNPHGLYRRLRQIARRFPKFDRLYLTMTAELCDCFTTRREGVYHVLFCAERVAGKRWEKIGRAWTTEGRFVDFHEARWFALRCAASNWNALATYTAQLFPQGISVLIDIGSTTTDIVPLLDGEVAAGGRTDLDRLRTGELLYCGAARTPLMALGPRVAFRGAPHAVMAERFATTEDIYVLSGDLPENAEHLDTADGRPMTRPFAASRVLRMLGADFESVTPDAADELAQAFARRAEARLKGSLVRALAGLAARQGWKAASPRGLLDRVDRFIVSGSGAFIAQRAVARLAPATRVISLEERLGRDASVAACAVSLLRLAEADELAKTAKA